MVNVQHRYAVVGGRTVFYRESGDPGQPAVVLLHGAPASSFMFRGLLPLLGAEYHVVAPDLLGFGLSDAPAVEEFDYTFDTLTDSVAGLLDQLGLDRYAIYVQDYGAPVGWRLALRHPGRITAIVTQNGNAYTAGFADEAWKPFWAYADDPTPQTAGPLLEGLRLERIRWQYTHGVPDPTLVDPDAWIHDHAQVNRSGNPAVQLKLYREYPSNVALYPEVHEYFRASQVPLLAVWGRNDEIFAPAGAEAFRQDLPAAEVHLLDGGHFLLESALEPVAALMTEFLGRTLNDDRDAADQPVLDFLGSPERLLVAGEQSGGEFALFDTTAERGHTAPRHRHHRATETFIVLDGEILIEAGGERRVAGAGQVAVLPRDQVHTFMVVSPTARYMTLHTPAGFDAFVRDVSRIAQATGAPPDRAALVALAAEHGIDIVGPGLSLADHAE